MKKCLALAALLSCVGSLTHATTHWQTYSRLGFSDYILQNAQGQKLTIACNRNAGEQYDHAVSFSMNHLEYHNTERQIPLTFILDQSTTITPPATTTSRTDAQVWNQFKNAIAKAKQVDILLNNTKIGSFYPSTQSINTVANEIHGCEALGL